VPERSPLVIVHRPPPANTFLFLDRDGVLIENCDNYVLSERDVTHLEGAGQAVRLANTSDMSVAVVTNQSAIGRGLLTREKAIEIQLGVVSALEAQGAQIHISAICPHAPHHQCHCRKPKPGLIDAVANEAAVNVPNSWLVGDALTDLQAARAAGVRHVLVRTGRGAAQFKTYEPDHTLPEIDVVDNVLDAVQRITGS